MKYCEICGNKFTKNKKGYALRRHIDGLTMCVNCVRPYLKEKEFYDNNILGKDYKEKCDKCGYDRLSLKYNNKFLCDDCIREEKKVIRKAKARDRRIKIDKEIREYRKERETYLKSIPPEDFIAIVRGEKKYEV